MSLIALLVTLVVAGLLMARLGSGPAPGSATRAIPPAQTTQSVQRAADAAAQGDRQRLDDAMKALH